MLLWLTKGGTESLAEAEISSRAPAGGVAERDELEVGEGDGNTRRMSRVTGRRKRRMQAAGQTRRLQA